VGVYIFSQAVNEAEAIEEARYVLSELQGRNLDLPVVLDYELATDASGYLGRLYEADLSGEQYAAVCLAFCREIEAEGYTAAVYAGQSMLRDSVGDALAAAGYPVWLAHWTVQTRFNGAYDYWQYSGSGRVSGIDTDVDLDMRYVTAPPQVSGLTARRDDGRNVLQWDRVPGVQGYVVFRSAPDSGFAEIARLSGAGSVRFTDAGADARCRYMVCAVVRVEGSDLRGVLSDIAEVED
jgi:Lyzozyme M1 (1,4-beta-N-acetylmuramidase)